MILLLLLLFIAPVLSQTQCSVFVDSAMGSATAPCGSAVGAMACKTFQLGVDAVNNLTAAQLQNCTDLAMKLAPGNYSGAGNIGVQFTPALQAPLVLKIDGGVAGNAVFDATGMTNVSIWSVTLPANQHVQLFAVTFANGLCDCNGGAIHVNAAANSSIDFFETQFINNVAVAGGAIWISGNGNLILNAATFIRNTATITTGECSNGGGAVFASNIQQIDVDFCNFRQNTALNSCGGAVFAAGTADVDVDDTGFTENQATSGGALFVSDVTMNSWGDDVFTSNIALETGGGMYVTKSGFAMALSVWLLNSAKSAGALRVFQSTMQFSTVNMTLNNAMVNGGAIMISGHMPTGTNVFDNITYTGNVALMNGNSLFCSDTRAIFNPAPPAVDSACDMTCLNDQGTCACVTCQTPTTVTTTVTTKANGTTTTPMPTTPGGSPWPTVILVVIIVLVIGGIIGGIFYYRKHSASGRAKFLNI